MKLLGNAAIPDDAALATFTYWSLGTGTSQPPGAWVQVALAVTAESPLPLPEMVRLFALLSMAMSDTVAPTVMTKFVHHHLYELFGGGSRGRSLAGRRRDPFRVRQRRRAGGGTSGRRGDRGQLAAAPARANTFRLVPAVTNT